MNRRNFLKGLAITAAGIAVPELILPPEPEKRFWALDRTMITDPVIYSHADFMRIMDDYEIRFIERVYPYLGSRIQPIGEWDRDTERVTFHGFYENGEMILQQNAPPASSEVGSWVRWGIVNQQS
jgi:hypothetical protein